MLKIQKECRLNFNGGEYAPSGLFLMSHLKEFASPNLLDFQL